MVLAGLRKGSWEESMFELKEDERESLGGRGIGAKASLCHCSLK